MSNIPVGLTSTYHTHKRKCSWNEISFEISLIFLLSTHLSCHISRPFIDCIISLYCKVCAPLGYETMGLSCL
uniref:Ovule protein n=1 Tax=Heterorhabditis bacteriophora TaxID=37862 RepID=A0A1I7X6W2_HETBA